jgi:hypothetical protein
MMMQTMKNSSHPFKSDLAARPVLTQAQNNTTLWIGHLKTDPTDHFAGQTFTCPADGQLNNIQLYSSAVQYAGEVTLTLHEFNPSSKQWGPAIGNSALTVNKDDHTTWIRFALPPVPLRKDVTYGFRVQTDEAMIGLGEAASGTKNPFTFGHEWSGDSRNQAGHYYSYFSLAFKVELCA